MELKWSNLTKSRCPRCNKYLYFDPEDSGNPWITCGFGCDFQIKTDRMQEIITRIVSRKIDWDPDIEGSEGQ